MVTINKIKIDGLYSYQQSQEITLGQNNMIVGPNDSGKSSILKSLKYMIECLAVYERDRDRPWNKYGEYANISLNLEFTDDEKRFLLDLLSIGPHDEHRNNFRLVKYKDESIIFPKLEKINLSVIWRTSDITDSRYNFVCIMDIPELGLKIRSQEYNLSGYVTIDEKIDSRSQKKPNLFLAEILDQINWSKVTKEELSGMFPEDSERKISVEEFPSPQQFSDTIRSPHEVFAPNRVRIENIIKMSGIKPQHGQKYSFFYMIGNLLKNRINFVSEQRRFNDTNSLTKQDLFDDGGNLQSFLFWLQSSTNPEDKKLYSKIREIFSQVMKSQKLSFETSLTEKEIEKKQNFDWSPTKTIPDKVTINFSEKVKDTENVYNFTGVGAGVRECLFLITKCLTSKQTVIAMDEPALNLHPSQIKTLMKKISLENESDPANKNQFVIITHSPTLANLDMLTEMNEIIRIKKKLGMSRVSQPSEDNKKWLMENLPTFHLLRSDVLFAKVVILVEGSSDQIFLETILKHEINNPEIPSDAILVLEVGGAKSFPKFRKFLSMFSIPHLVLADNDVQNRFEENEFNVVDDGTVDAKKPVLVLKDKNLEAYLSRIDTELFESLSKKYDRKQEVAYFFISELLSNEVPKQLEPMIQLLKQTGNYV